MKKYIATVVTAIIIALATFVLSNTAFEPVDMLMRPPKNEGQNSDIQEAFEASINDKYILRSPLSGDYKSSFILVDINGDKSNEVIVFYSLSGAPDVVRMNVICYINGTWRSVADLESAHKQIHKVDFADVDKDGMLEIIAGWSISDSELLNTLNIYNLNTENGNLTVEKIFENNYMDFIVCDVNADLKNDILLFDKQHTDNVSIRALYYDFVGGKAYETGDFYIDASISSVYSVNFDKDKVSGNTCFYVDGYRFDSGMTTDMFCWDKKEKRFSKYYVEDSKSVSALATRSMIITCQDVNNDGSFDIPFEDYIDDSEVIVQEKSLHKLQNIIKWMSYDEQGFSPVYCEIFNSKNNYSLKIKNDWVGTFTVKNEQEKGLMTFYRVGGTENSFSGFGDIEEQDDIFDFAFDDEISNDNRLFSILCVAENSVDVYDLSGYKLLKTDNGLNYYCYIYKEGRKSSITRDLLKKLLVT